RTGVDRRLHVRAALIGHVLLPDQDVVVAELEDIRGHEHAFAVALAQVHVDVNFHVVLLSTMRSASSSGTASATCSVLADTAGCSPAEDRSTSQSTMVFCTRPRPLTSTATTSPGSIGRERAGVPVSTTSPGSSVLSRRR